MANEPKYPQDVTREPSLAAALISGSSWTILIRWATRLLGIISLAICARILTPADYGLISMAMVVVGFSAILVEFGIDASLIRTQSPSAALYNTAWTLRIIQGTIIASIVFVAAPIAAYFYKDPRVIPIMFAVGAAGLIGSLQNVYVVNFRKSLNFRLDFVFSFIPRFSSFLAAVSAVVILESYWGLVIGICANEIVRTITSYVMIKQRASWSLAEWRDLTSFSGWYFLRGLGEFMTYEFDRFLLGTLAGAQKTGLYSVSRQISDLPATEIVLPIGRALLPTLSKLNDQPERLRAAIEKTITATLIVAAPAALGFAVIAPEFVLLLFGTRWMDAMSLVAIFSIGAMLSGFRTTAANVFVVTGHLKANAALSWIQATYVLSLFYPVYLMSDVTGIAWLYVSSGFLMSGLYAFLLSRNGLVAGRSLWWGIFRPLLSAVVMYFLVVMLTPNLSGLPLMAILASKITVGGIVYTITLLTLWVAMGRPNSSESTLLELAMDKTRALLAKRHEK